MAPHNKRATSAKASTPTKKAKVHTEEPSDALKPILEAVAASKEGEQCYDMLRVALPHCLASPAAERHSFQTRMLDLTTTVLKDMEASARKELSDAEAQVDKLRTEAAMAKANLEVAQSQAKSKLEASNSKGQEAEKLQSDVNAAKEAVQVEVGKKEDFLKGKATLATDQEEFTALCDSTWEALKTCQFAPQAWRKRDKALTDLIEKLRLVPMEESLLQGLQVALKMKQDQRTSFAQTAISSAEEALSNHKALLAERLASTASDEAACEQAVTEADAKLTEIKEQHAKEDKEYDELQNAWAQLESQATEADTTASKLDQDVEAALSEVEEQKHAVENAIAVVGSFDVLVNPPAVQPAVEESTEAVEAPVTGALDAPMEPVAAN